MTETEFFEASEALFEALITAVEEAGLDVECERSGNVLTIEADSGEEVVVNRHTPTQQMWIASRKGGKPVGLHERKKKNTRDASSFWAALNEALSFACGEAVEIRDPAA